MNEKEMQDYFESIDFLPLGEKIANLNRAIKTARNAGDSNRVRVLRKKRAREVEKLEEMRRIFNEFNAKMSASKLTAISYPDGVEVWKVDSKITPQTFFYFSCSGMKKWYGQNAKGLRPFKTPAVAEEIEETIIEQGAFGIAGWSLTRGKQFYEVKFIQPLLFYKRKLKERGLERGIKQPLQNAHILILFLLLKETKARGMKLLQLTIEREKIKEKVPQILQIYKEIAKMATFYYGHYGIAQFKKK